MTFFRADEQDRIQLELCSRLFVKHMGGVFTAPSSRGSQLLVTLVAWYLTLSSEHHRHLHTCVYSCTHTIKNHLKEIKIEQNVKIPFTRPSRGSANTTASRVVVHRRQKAVGLNTSQYRNWLQIVILDLFKHNLTWWKFFSGNNSILCV